MLEEPLIVLTGESLIVVAVVAAVLQLLKRIPALAVLTAWLPLVSLGLGVGGAFLWGVTDPLPTGILIGLVASGGYDVLKRPT